VTEPSSTGDRLPSVADLPPDRKSIHNERAKCMATWLNSAGASAVTVGVIAPLAALAFGYPNSPVPLDGLLLGMGLFLLRERCYISWRGSCSGG
jgi:hypothetical protein